MDTFDYQRSSVPARLPSQRVVSLAAHRLEGSSTENLPSPISVRAVLRASRRYWWLIIALWTVGSAGIGAAVYFKIKPQYMASSLLKVEPTVIDLYGGTSREGGETFMLTHVALIKSNNVLADAVLVPGVTALPRIRTARDPIQELRKVILVLIQPGTHLIEVSMTSPSAEEAATIVNAVVSSFLEKNSDWTTGATTSQIKKLDAYKAKLQLDIKKTEDELESRTALGNSSGEVVKLVSPDLGEKKDKDDANALNLSVDYYHKLLSQCLQIKLDLLTAEANLGEAKRISQEVRVSPAISDPTRANALVERRLRSDAELNALVREFNSANSSADKVRGTARNSGDPAEVKARDKASSLSKRYKELVEVKRQQIQDEINSNPNAKDPEVQVAEASALVNNLTNQKSHMESELSRIKLENTKKQSDGLKIRFLEEERRTLKDMESIVIRRSEQLGIDAVAEDQIRRINEARPEGQAISDKRMQYMAMAPVGILGAVLGLVILLEVRSGRVADTDVLAMRMRHEVFPIAPLPNVRSGLGLDTNEKAEQRLARFVQSLDHLRVALCEGGTNGEGRCVMITSATGGEGKTTLSAHLAARCANAGTSTLLIDADLRRASLGRLLDVPPGLGLGDLLAGEVELDPGLINEQPSGFHFLSAGSTGIDPTRVLKSTRLAELIGQFRQMYDLVIIDTPPVLPVPDALILGRWADGAVMAARYDASRLPLVERANRQLVAAGIPVLGVVVNGVKGQDQAYGNYAYNYNYPGRQQSTNETADVS